MEQDSFSWVGGTSRRTDDSQQREAGAETMGKLSPQQNQHGDRAKLRR